MHLFPAIDVYDGKAVRLKKGEYADMTVYSPDPPAVARSFCQAGAAYLHVVDLEGAKAGEPRNAAVICRILRESGLKAEVGGGIRTQSDIARYLDAGALRVILGTAALTEPSFLARMAAQYGDALAVGVDAREGRVAIRGWVETSDTDCFAFCRTLQGLGIRTVICTDISKDGLLGGANRALYAELSQAVSMDIIASGGVSTLEDIRALADMGLYGAIVGKALYTGDLKLQQALAAAAGVGV
ncbi:MAG: 1-(5-phosphoribosyl)-5-[(5-phosphoribosylamino)methylideneamino]imidazole-4-carboxamide isomerase [Christensenellaceae bacterium]|jgi:phosphoribosylformimino-5-aminoimidazole carboxamide ribotide isomerase|nr:1-(5-phosphoribosyl)-5-[(5-phosphoribosylamino)methylideneamino]imidazole-4-carboxamide isomerase [Christensenellaceae bacterium]